MASKTRWWLGLSLGIVVGIGILGSRREGSEGQLAPAILAGRPECPHDWDFKRGQMPIVASNIDIPEFHDCQRFIVVNPGGDTSYQELYAIFAADALRGMDSMSTGTWMPVAEIYAEGTYAPLGIRGPYSCLFLSRRGESEFDARMVPLTRPDDDCRRILNVADTGQQLRVHRTTAPFQAAPSDYPPVARWDWDSLHSKQYIGVKCGDGWCEVGDMDLAVWPRPTTFRLGDNSKVLRTRLIKGWYDEQLLAIRDEQGQTVTSAIRGIIYPHAGLDEHARVEAFDRRWIPVADVALEVPPGTPTSIPNQYKARMNLDVTLPSAGLSLDGPLNHISLCRGNANSCGLKAPLTCGGDLPAWWSRIVSASGRDTAYYCVVRRGHGALAERFPHHRIPGTARWRWMASDEGTWNACVQGCCEVSGF